jgi:hypothetical protein
MFNLLGTNYKREYLNILSDSFPKILKTDLETVLDCLPINDNNVKLCDGQIHKVENLIHTSNQKVVLDNVVLTIPYRIYFNEPNSEKEKLLSENQKIILNCIYLRHHNGFIRQKRLELLNDKNHYWITPFMFQLLGEYVVEIIITLDKNFNDTTLENFRLFINENPIYWQQTKSRVISYWNEYYRHSKNPILKHYIGQKIVDRIRKANA